MCRHVLVKVVQTNTHTSPIFFYYIFLLVGSKYGGARKPLGPKFSDYNGQLSWATIRAGPKLTCSETNIFNEI